jgi:hypothetical protein
MRAAIVAVTGIVLGSFQAPDAGQVRDSLDAYLRAYEPQLSALVAEEHMQQRVGPSRQALNVVPKIENRALVAEVAFVNLPGEAGWLGFRRVTNINGRPVKDPGQTLARLLSGGRGDRDQAHLLLEQSASYNLGSPRTTNLPNLPLELLHPRHRPRFTQRIDGRERIRGTETMRLVFDERSTPTIIQRPEGGDMLTKVMAWIEPRTGRLLRAHVTISDARFGIQQFPSTVWVDFREHESFGLLVPVEMKEEFFAGRFNEGTSAAKYSNYRKFQTSARVVQPVQ